MTMHLIVTTIVALVTSAGTTAAAQPAPVSCDISTSGRPWIVTVTRDADGRLHGVVDDGVRWSTAPPADALGFDRVVVGPDHDGDGVRELFASTRHLDGTTWLTVLDAIDGGIRVMVPLDPSGPDPWVIAAADRNGDGEVNADDLRIVFEAAPSTGAVWRASVGSILESWGQRMAHAAPALDVPLECVAPCLMTICPECLHGVCCRLPNGTPCGICFDGGGGGGGGGGGHGGGGHGGGGGGGGGGKSGDPSNEPESAPAPGDSCIRLDAGDDDPSAPARLGDRRCYTVVAPEDCPVVWTIEGAGCFTDGPDGACVGHETVAMDGDRLCIRFTGCGEAVVRATPGCHCPRGVFAPVTVPVIGVDLDVDSDHDDPDSMPSGDAAEDRFEDRSPGRLLIAATADGDGDGIPAWADGMSAWHAPDAAASPGSMIPVRLELPSRSLAGVEFRLHYDASDPASMPIARPMTFDGTDPPPGTFRLWRRRNGRDRRDAAFGGDFLSADRWYPRSVLGGGRATAADLWLEALRGSTADDRTRRLRIEIRLNDGDPDLPASGPCLEDAVAVTAVQATLLDLRDWGPRPGVDGPRLADPDLRRPAGWSDRIAGAVADGASPVLVRFEPDVFSQAGIDPVVTVRRHRRDGRRIGTADRVGSLHPVPTEIRRHAWNPPRVPLQPAEGITSDVAIIEAAVLWVPPIGIARGAATPDAVVLDPHTPTVGLSLDVGVAGGPSLGAAGVWLREPPLVRVHGILSSPSDAFGVPMWNALGPRHVVDADWSRSSDGSRPTDHLGFEENVGAVALAIDRAVRDLRSDAVVPRRYAATRADVVAHSQGGAIIAWYAADLQNGAASRAPGYPPIVVRRHPRPSPGDDPERGGGRWPFVDASNWEAGPVNRFISIGSPLRGTPLAAMLTPVFGDTPAAIAKLRRWRRGDPPMPAALAERFWPGPDPTFLAPSCIPDLAEGGTAQRILGGAGPIPARPPLDRAAVQWLAIGTTWNGDPDDRPTAPPPVAALHALLGVDPDSAPAVVADAVAAVRTMLRLIGPGTNSDLVVPLASQFGLDDLIVYPANRRFRPWIAHSEPFGFLGETQLRSPDIVADVRAALSQPLDDLDLGLAPVGPPGPPRSRRHHAFGRLDLGAR